MPAFVVLTLVAAPIAAHADDLSGGGSDYVDTYTPSSDTSGSDYVDTYTPSSSGSDYVDTYTPSYSTPSYSTGTSYSTPSYSTSAYTLPSYSYSTPTYSTPSYTTNPTSSNTYAPSTTYVPTYDNGNTSTYAPVTDTTTNNSCTGNSCNTTVTNPAPVINNNDIVANYAAAQVPVYTNPAPVVYQAPVAYNAATPYVTLTQVPYTGLDLGFWGTIAYWGFMIGFALVVAYLIAIKRVQNGIAKSLKHFLFGSTDGDDKGTLMLVRQASVVVTAPAHAQTSEDIIDSFILSQINRPRRA